MTFHGFGYVSSEAAPACAHQGEWDFSTLAGLAFKACRTCGTSWYLWQLENGTYVWMPCLEATPDEIELAGVPLLIVEAETSDDTVAVVAEDV